MARALCLLVLLAVVALAGCGGDPTPGEDVAAGRAGLLDVRTQGEWDAGHAEDAEHVPLADVKAGRRPEADRGERLYVYCRTGRRAAEAVRILRRDGWTDVVNAGGLEDWRKRSG